MGERMATEQERLARRIVAGEIPAGASTMTAAAPLAPAMSPRMRAFILGVDRGILGIARHWLVFVNLISGLFVGLALAGPWLRAQGYDLAANVIYAFYRLTCHQLPERSFFIFGHKMCLCQRCIAIYGGVVFFGVVYPLLRRLRGRIRPLRWRWMFLLWTPMALDGFTQLFGLRESTWELRVITGTLFALSCVWVGFPYLEQAFGEIRDQLERRFARSGVGHEA